VASSSSETWGRVVEVAGAGGFADDEDDDDEDAEGADGEDDDGADEEDDDDADEADDEGVGAGVSWGAVTFLLVVSAFTLEALPPCTLGSGVGVGALIRRTICSSLASLDFAASASFWKWALIVSISFWRRSTTLSSAHLRLGPAL